MSITPWPSVTTAKFSRVWLEEGFEVPQQQPPRGRLWLHEGSCVRIRATHPNHVWSDDFVFISGAYGGKIRLLTMIDEYTKVYLIIHCARSIGSIQVIEQLANAMVIYGSTVLW